MRREQRGLRLGEQEIHDHPPPRPCPPGGPGQDHRVPEEERRQEEAGVLDVMPEIGSERHVIECGHMPGPERDDERYPGDARIREDAGEPPHGPRRQRRGHRAPGGKRQPLSSGATGAPSQSSGGATTISKRCWTMCARSHRWPSASMGEQSARNTMPSPAANAAARPAPKRSGMRGRSAAQPRT